MPSPTVNLLLRSSRFRVESLGADLGVWLRASSLGLANEAPVDTWTDLSGNGNSPTQTGTKRPFYIVDGIGGQPAIQLDNVDDVMFSPEAPILGGYAGATVFLVYQMLSNPSGSVGGIALIQSNASLRFAINFRNAAGIYDEVGGRRLESDSFQATTHNLGYVSTPKILAVRINYLGATLEKWTNGSLNQTLNPFQTPGVSASNNVSLRIGHTTIATHAKYAELIIIRRVLTMTEFVQANQYLSSRYQIPLV